MRTLSQTIDTFNKSKRINLKTKDNQKKSVPITEKMYTKNDQKRSALYLQDILLRNSKHIKQIIKN